MDSERCGVKHPKLGTTCYLRDRHPMHIDSDGNRWENPDYVEAHKPPPDRETEIAESVESEGNVVPMARKTHGGYPRPDDPERRMEGAEKAGSADPEMEQHAIEVVAEIAALHHRLTADDVWDWCAARGYFTDHPKGMTAWLRRCITLGLIFKIGEHDPDHERKSKYTNSSRRLQVYGSCALGAGPPGSRAGLPEPRVEAEPQPTGTEAPLRNFD